MLIERKVPVEDNIPKSLTVITMESSFPMHKQNRQYRCSLIDHCLRVDHAMLHFFTAINHK
jgi:hypothetical protein